MEARRLLCLPVNGRETARGSRSRAPKGPLLFPFRAATAREGILFCVNLHGAGGLLIPAKLRGRKVYLSGKMRDSLRAYANARGPLLFLSAALAAAGGFRELLSKAKLLDASRRDKLYDYRALSRILR